ncbi:SDR family oxidoreductase [Anaerolineales bacterium]
MKNIRYDFSGKAVLVSGAGSGIGFSICEAFAKAGAKVALNDIDADLAQKAAETINQSIGKEQVYPFGFDIADTAAMKASFAAIITELGQIDILIANAGITNFGRFLDYEEKAFDRLMAVNLKGSFFSAQVVAKQMIEKQIQAGRIIFLSSVTGKMAYPNLSAYGMSKAALSHLTSVLALELGAYDITVNAICPGATVTERTLVDDPQYEANWKLVSPNQRVGMVTDMANGALFFATEEAAHINGQTLIIDGGWTNSSPIPEDTPDLPTFSTQLR